MRYSPIEGTDKLRQDRARRAIALAMQNRWSEAIETNLSIVSDYPR